MAVFARAPNDHGVRTNYASERAGREVVGHGFAVIRMQALAAIKATSRGHRGILVP